MTLTRLPDSSPKRPRIRCDFHVANRARIVPPVKLPSLEALFSWCDSTEPRVAASTFLPYGLTHMHRLGTTITLLRLESGGPVIEKALITSAATVLSESERQKCVRNSAPIEPTTRVAGDVNHGSRLPESSRRFEAATGGNAPRHASHIFTDSSPYASRATIER